MAKRESSALKPGSKIANFFAYLKHEMVTSELIVNREHIQRVMDQLKIRRDDTVYGMLHVLERKGLINRSRRKGVKGIVVSFKSEEKSRNPFTVDELIANLRMEIDVLKVKQEQIGKKITTKTKFYDQLVAMERR